MAAHLHFMSRSLPLRNHLMATIARLQTKPFKVAPAQSWPVSQTVKVPGGRRTYSGSASPSKSSAGSSSSGSSSGNVTATTTITTATAAVPPRQSKFRQYAEQFKNKPASHLISFGVLHEITAVVPLPIIYVFLAETGIQIPFPEQAMEEGNRFVARVAKYYGWDLEGADGARVMFNMATSYAVVKDKEESLKMLSTAGDSFSKFRNNYLSVYLTVMMSDWLQGPYLYKLYESYHFEMYDIAVLFIIGFVSSAVFGTLVANTADVWGRKRMALLFCFTSSTASLIRLSNNYHYLVLSHLLSGLSTALLYCVFEAWYISQHQRKGFAPTLIGATFSTAIFLNGLVAIFAGIVANIAVEWSGSLSAPFVVSAGTLVFGGLLISSTWEENYGESKTNAGGSIIKNMLEGLIVLKNDTNILALGLAQTVFECCMYTFVLLYTPALETSVKNTSGSTAPFPLGYLFSAMMFSTMVGSLGFKFMSSNTLKPDMVLSMALIAAGASFCLITMSAYSSTHTVIAFLLFEFTTGLYFPSIGTLRAQTIPEQNRTGVMAFLRVPMNFAVCAILLRVDTLPVSQIFQICALLSFGGGLTILVRALDPARQHGYGAVEAEENHEL
ncbi:Molybdate-anion transporter [Lunasporangiospora selenospora]|uniref:Molybdate-anion transporter n=1 Tax=Lunasporangiospora selenospora TaxID=979761 RepID=A0A9P6FNS2_9FUNG|nr:Molybdate-anion transporter [Lunasporangiospora selenospora]